MLLPKVTLIIGLLGPLLSGAALSAESGLTSLCESQLKKMPGKVNDAAVNQVCQKVRQLDGCISHEKTPIYHFDSAAKDPKTAKRVLVLSLLHGDEHHSGSVAREWMSRLLNIESRSDWRIVPVLNPDGWKRNQRMNKAGVDLNRNFPSKDWEATALSDWDKHHKKDPRRYPGPKPASEPETICAIKHIDDFKPDFIISIHTPYGVLDFDGPQVTFPNFRHLPWASLGTFPGSLGRYMWVDRKVPVLTIELKDEKILADVGQLGFLQDVAGTVAIRANKKKPYNEARE